VRTAALMWLREWPGWCDIMVLHELFQSDSWPSDHCVSRRSSKYPWLHPHTGFHDMKLISNGWLLVMVELHSVCQCNTSWHRAGAIWKFLKSMLVLCRGWQTPTDNSCIGRTTWATVHTLKASIRLLYSDYTMWGQLVICIGMPVGFLISPLCKPLH
jgi:hypothetical protein